MAALESLVAVLPADRRRRSSWAGIPRPGKSLLPKVLARGGRCRPRIRDRDPNEPRAHLRRPNRPPPARAAATGSAEPRPRAAASARRSNLSSARSEPPRAAASSAWCSPGARRRHGRVVTVAARRDPIVQDPADAPHPGMPGNTLDAARDALVVPAERGFEQPARTPSSRDPAPAEAVIVPDVDRFETDLHAARPPLAVSCLSPASRCRNCAEDGLHPLPVPHRAARTRRGAHRPQQRKALPRPRAPLSAGSGTDRIRSHARSYESASRPGALEEAPARRATQCSRRSTRCSSS